MRPDDLTLMKGVSDPQIASDGLRVAWTENSFDIDKDTPVSRIVVAPSDGTGSPRDFTSGPADSMARWSPAGDYLAYLSAGEGVPTAYLASLEGGTPVKVVTPGPVSWIEWSPDGQALALVVGTGLKDPTTANAPRVVRGAHSRLDGRGWLDGRTQIFVYDISSTIARQVTSGDYDHEQPSSSPNGERLVFVSDRSRQRNDIGERGEVWTVTATGGRPQRISTTLTTPSSPRFSPDGRRIAVCAITALEQPAGANAQILVFDALTPGEATIVSRDLDRPVSDLAPFRWLSSSELIFAVCDHGAISLVRARVGRRNATTVVSGDTQVYGFATFADRSQSLLAYCSAWIDQPGDVFVRELEDSPKRPVRVSRASDDLLATVTLAGARRRKVRARDGLEIEYFEMSPPRTASRGRVKTTPLYLEIHGGPQGFNPLFILLPYYQTLVAAGYRVILPNPRGSTGYGEDFSLAVNGDWGGEDYFDLMACVDDAVRRGHVDEQRLFVGGYSYGGYMTSFIVGQTDRFRAAVIGAPVVNLISEFGASDAGWWLAKTLDGDPWRTTALYRDRSPLTHANRVTTPVFLHVSEGDLCINDSDSYEFYTALKSRGKTVEYVRYPGGSHQALAPLGAPPSQNRDRMNRILDFLARHGGVKVRSTSSR